MFRATKNHWKKYVEVLKEEYPGERNARGKPPEYYAPFVTKWPVLTSIIITLLVCVALLEFGLRTGTTLEEKNKQEARVRKRQDTSTTTPPVVTAVTYATSTDAYAVAATTTSTTAAYVTPTTTSAVASSSTLASSAYATPDTTTPNQSTGGTSYTSSGGYATPETTPQSTGGTSYTSSGGYATPETTPQSTGGTSYTSSGGYATPVPTTEATTTGITLTTSTNAYATPEPTSEKTTEKSTTSISAYATPVTTTTGVTLSTSTSAYATPKSTYAVPETTSGEKTKETTKTTSALATTTSAYVTPKTTEPTSSRITTTTAYATASTTSNAYATASTTTNAYVTPKTSGGTFTGTTVDPLSTVEGSFPSETVVTQSIDPEAYATNSVTGSYSVYLVAQITTDSTGGVATVLATESTYVPGSTNAVAESHSIYVTTQLATDSTGGVSTIIATKTTNVPVNTRPASASYSTYVTTQLMTDSTGGVSTIVATKTGLLEGTITATGFYYVYVTTQLTTDSTGGVSTITATATTYVPGSTTVGVLGQEAGCEASPTITPSVQDADEVELGLVLSPSEYFRTMYMPVVVAVLLKLFWSVVYSSTKVMEPFYQLSSKDGASAKDALVINYVTSTLSLEGIRNILAGHPVVILASFAYISLSLLPAFATKTSGIKATGICCSGTGYTHCNPMWELSIPFSRVMQGILAFVALLILVMMILSARRKSGVFSNPSSIATMSSLLSNDEFISDLRNMPQGASRSWIKSALDPARWILAQYQTKAGHARYGIVKSGAFTQRSGLNLQNQRHHHYAALSNPSASQYTIQKSRGSISNRLLFDTLFLMLMAVVLCILVAYYLTGSENWFNNFFNRNPFRRFVLTLAASLLDSRWKQIEREVRMLTPYRRLFEGSAKPENTILVTQNATAITSFFPAIRRANFFHAYIAFVATLSDILIIVIGGVPFNEGQFHLDFIVCIYTSWTILAIMILTVIAIFRWRAFNERMMIPRNPSNLVAVWLMLCNEGNGVCKEMQGTETIGQDARNKKVLARDSRYWAGWITEPSGHQRWVIEREGAVVGAGADAVPVTMFGYEYYRHKPHSPAGLQLAVPPDPASMRALI